MPSVQAVIGVTTSSDWDFASLRMADRAPPALKHWAACGSLTIPKRLCVHELLRLRSTASATNAPSQGPSHSRDGRDLRKTGKNNKAGDEKLGRRGKHVADRKWDEESWKRGGLEVKVMQRGSEDEGEDGRAETPYG
jgi:hypothetical protein